MRRKVKTTEAGEDAGVTATNIAEKKTIPEKYKKLFSFYGANDISFSRISYDKQV